MKLSAQGQLRLAAKLAFAAGAGSLLGVAQAAASTDAPASGASAAAAKDANLQLAQAGTATGAGTTAPASTGTPVQLQGVEVTGSRIKQPSLTGSAALQAIDSKEFKLEGTQNVEQLLNSLPSVFAAQNNTGNNGSTGTATVDLRGLGVARTLTLIDGKRVMPGDPRGGPEVDLNFIPSALVERVEVLTGGASAVYGSDAISGVVNFIMKKDFDGFSIDAQANRTDSGDGTTQDTTLVWGSNFAGGAGNVTLYASHTRFDAIDGDQRGFSKFFITTPASGDRHITGPTSSMIKNGRFISYDRLNAGLPFDYMADPNGSGTFVPYDGRKFNFAPFDLLQRPDQRYTLGGFAHRQFNEHVDVYGSAMFMDDRTSFQLGPGGTFFNNFNVNCDNPLLSAQERKLLCTDAGLGPTDNARLQIAKRDFEFGNRENDTRHTDYRIVFGLRGTIIDDLSYDVSAQRGETVLAQSFRNELSLSRTQQALQATTDANGNIVCKDPTGGCVPFNLFQANAVTPAQVDFLRADGFEQGNTVEEIVSASVNGDLTPYGIVSPLAKTGVGVALGYEFRKESLELRPDQTFQSGDQAGGGGTIPPVTGNFNVKDYFGELQLPIVEDQPFVKSLSFDTAYRVSNYTTQARYTHAYKFGLKYFPIEDIGLRGSWNRAVRAPDIQELFFPNSVNIFGGSDPCAGAIDPATGIVAGGATLAQCQRTGVTPSQYGNIVDCNSGQCNAEFGGNQNLKAERAITRQAGLVLQPRFLKGFTGTIDYYQITIADRIGTIGANTILSECIQQGAFCNNIHRGSGGRIWGPRTNFVADTNINTGFLKERGVDFSFHYNRYLSDLGLGNLGRVDLTFTGTYLNSFSQKNAPGLPIFDCAGLFGLTCGEPNPRWRHKLRTTWLAPSDTIIAGLGVSVQWRYISSVALDKNKTGTILASGKPDLIDGEIPKKQYMDLTMTYRLPISTQDVTLRFGVNNLTNTDPPLVSSNSPNSIASPPFGNNNTFPGVYDSLGRVFFLGVNANFR
ncbi:MAG: TonB-dependent receptor [Gammaproteobacteria bacterium]|nr:TonB-dependent receptor [Gammaproteobacteria bacterium]